MRKSILLKNKPYQCEICHITNWQNSEITLEMDHIDGNNRNNDISNVRFLCPNCHSQTKNWRGRNINSGLTKVSDEELIEALQNSENIRQALIKTGLTPKGGNYKRASKLLNFTSSKSTNLTLWINNGSINKKIKKQNLDEYTSNGWTTGRILNSRPPSQKGKIWITNGFNNQMITKETTIPQGWFKGKVQN